MNRWLGIVVLAIQLLDPPAVASQRSLDDAAIKRILEGRIDNARRGVGIVVGVVDANGRQIVSHGRMNRDTDRQPGPGALFEIGSITKVFTSLLLADMVERGELGLDDPVAAFLPPSVQVPGSEGRQITLRDLSTHHSGLPRMPDNFAPADPDNPFADYSVEQLYQFLHQYRLPREVGAQFEYSNLGVGLLGHALALKVGTGFEALLIERIIEPLMLSDTRITLDPEQRSRLATGHDIGGNPVPNWDLTSLAGAGALRSTTHDMLDFLMANMNLSESSLSTALEATHVRQNGTDTPGMSIGLGWLILNASGHRIHWHNGGTGGYRTFIGFDKGRQRGVVVLSNSANDVTDIGLHLFDNVFPLATLHPLPEIADVDPAILADYVGEYELVPGFILTVTQQGNRLVVQATGQSSAEVFPASDTKFFYTIVEAQITFVRDASGKVTHLTLHQGGVDQDARRLPGPTAVLEHLTASLPNQPGLDQNYPNPFNSNTIIRFALSASTEVDLGIYTLTGQRIATLVSGWRQAGTYRLHWDGVDDAGGRLASGIYMYRLMVGGQVVSRRKLSLLR